MPRIRTVKPELASDRKLASVSRDARYTFVLLISQADDDGLLRAEPRQLLGSLYPFDHDVTGPELDGWLEELRGKGLIRWRRTLDGVRVIELVNWSKHQFIKNRAKPFLLTQLAEYEEGETGASVCPTEEVRSESGGAGGAESRVLSPEPRVLSSPSGDTNGAAGKQPKLVRPPPAMPNWVNEAVEIYAKHIGVVSHGKAGKLLKPVVDKRGWTEVRDVLQCFCELSPYDDYLTRAEANTLRPGEEKAKKLGYHTTLAAFVERYTHWHSYLQVQP